ncbi:MAG: hypothetical protein IT573_10880 [Deltaproteobacteria bacterium]|nr:hypothetical protein [Deltaproteobacteria bacterium]
MFGLRFFHASLRRSTPLALLLLMACSGSATLTGPSAPEGPGGGALDAPASGGTATTMAAAQPLTAGFPAPEQDPTGKFFTVKIIEEKPVCRLLGKDVVQYKIRGLVTPAWTEETPENLAEFLAMGSLRVVDQLNGKYLELPLSSMATYDEFGIKTHKLGYFEFTLVSSGQYHLSLYPLQPVSTTPVETPWTACPDSECAPTKQTVKIFAKTESGDLTKAGLLAGVIPVCQIGGGALDWPAEE